MIKGLFKISGLLILVIFIASYCVSNSGYYEYTMKQRTIITSDKIKEFEQDVRENKEVDLKNYLEKDDINYSNKITSLVYNISDSSNKIARKIIKKIFNKISSLVEE